MADHSTTAAAHGHDDAHGADDGRIHAHVASVRFYVSVFVGLVTLTALTILVGEFHMGALNLALAVIIASAKAALVVTFFMHLSHDRRFNAILLIAALLFIGVFFAYTMNDTTRRAEVDPNSASQIYGPTGEKAPGGSEIPIFREPGAGAGEGEGHGSAEHH